MRTPGKASFLAAIALAATLHAGHALPGDGGCDGSPLNPANRLARLASQPPGTEHTYCIFYGPYTIPPGHDLSRVDLDLALTDGFVVAGGPTAVDVNGNEPSNQQVHIHHAHWWLIEPGSTNYGPNVPFPGWKWIAGSGEEKTNGDFGLIAAADPDPAAPRYGIETKAGDRVLQINMVHNKTAASWVVWIKVRLAFVHGTPKQIKAATGRDYRPLTPILVGGTFDVRRGAGNAGTYTYPLDATGSPSGDVVPGVGRVFTAPFSGTIVIGASHLHPGGKRATFTNLGQPAAPCANDRTDGIPGTTLYDLDVIDRTAPFSEDFQIEITQPGFRADVLAGDRLALNGIYESAGHAWWAAMAHTGFYIDPHPVAANRACAPRLVGTPPGWAPPVAVDPGSYVAVTDGVPNRPWTGDALPVCGPAYAEPCDKNLAPVPGSGMSAGLVTITDQQYFPGGLGLSGPLGAPAVKKGKTLRFLNTDFFAADIRHTVTSCVAPCDGSYWANYPLPDGGFDSGFLGWEPTTGGGGPEWTLDTAALDAGRYTYFCRIHPWMRGAFDVV